MSGGFDLLLSGADASSAARRAIDASNPSLPQTLRDDLALLVTGLVTNAVRHGGAASDRPLRVELRRRPGWVRVEVVDPGSEFESSAPVAGDSDGGWGLFLVDRISARWGVRPVPSGKCVWFELPVGATA
jgi:anti-sigma regulatory factor (Ser/Thr protein kinase)